MRKLGLALLCMLSACCLHAEEGAAVTGFVISKGKNWIAVARPGEADSTLFLPQWKGTAFDPEMLSKINATPVGAEVKLTFSKADEHLRLLSLEATGNKAPPTVALHVARPSQEKPAGEKPEKLTEKVAAEKPVPEKPAPEKPAADMQSAEPALRAAGWSTVSGAWRKKAEHVFEVTDGKLEAQKTNGLIQAVVHRGDATTKMLVRYGSGDKECPGFGVVITSAGCKLLTPYVGDDGEHVRFSPYVEKTAKLAPNLPKDDILIQIQDSKLQISVDGKREKLANYKISQKGTFVIEVSGTAVLEVPMAKDDSGLGGP